jgi:hypothetical protein
LFRDEPARCCQRSSLSVPAIWVSIFAPMVGHGIM